MTERQLLSQIREGGSTKEILEKMPNVQLQLIDGTMYADSGRVETISGVIDQTTGSVSMRALFPNKQHTCCVVEAPATWYSPTRWMMSS